MPSSSASLKKGSNTAISCVSNGWTGRSANPPRSTRTATPMHCAEPFEGCTQVCHSPSTSSSKNSCSSPVRLGPSTATTTSASSSSSAPERWSRRCRTVASVLWAVLSPSGLNSAGSSSSTETNRSFIHSKFQSKNLVSATVVLLTRFALAGQNRYQETTL